MDALPVRAGTGLAAMDALPVGAGTGLAAMNALPVRAGTGPCPRAVPPRAGESRRVFQNTSEFRAETVA